MFRCDVIAEGSRGPGERSRHCLAYDAERQTTVLFGGIVWRDGGNLRNDTWELRVGRWTKIDGKVGPVARHRGAMAHDPVRRVSVLFGGQTSDGSFLQDTWQYADGTWQPWRPGWFGRTPPFRCGHSLTYDEQSGLIVLFGGIDPNDRPLRDTWVFDGK
jgi:hypothetical protein